jgi:hypothetical protein
MRAPRTVLAAAAAAALVPPAAAALAPATAAAATSARLVLDTRAQREHVAEAAPSGPSPGDVQAVSGRLLDARGRAVGTYAVTCRTTRGIGDAARERCTGRGRLGGGSFRFRGPSGAAELLHHWTLRSGTGPFAGARGTLEVHDLGLRESVVLLQARGGAGLAGLPGSAPVPAAGRPVLRRAGAACRATARQLAALPPFPFSDFDPLHPDTARLPAVGHFFTGPGDPRPALRSLVARLAALHPPGLAGPWRALVGARRADLGVRNAQDRAALAADAAAFVASVRATHRVTRRLDLTALVAGAGDCTA